MRSHRARGVAAALVLLSSPLAAGVADAETTPRPRPTTAVPRSQVTDLGLYRAVVDDLRAGEPYHEAALREGHRMGYPVRPFYTVRQPALATLLAHVSEATARVLLSVLAALAALAWAWSRRTRGAADALTAGALVFLFSRPLVGADVRWHESWSSLLVAIAVPLAGAATWPLAVVAAISASLVRETAAPVVVIMLVSALRRGRRTEAGGWMIGAAIVALGLALHAAAVYAVPVPSERHGPGWLQVPGAWFAIRSTAMFVMDMGPSFLVSVGVAIVCVVGWLAAFVGDDLGAPAWQCGVLFACAFLARDDNVYWLAMCVPMLGLGPLFARDAIGCARTRGRRDARRAPCATGMTAEA